MGIITDDFLLKTKTAKLLFNTYAKDMPIIDYHCHIDPKEIAENKKFRSITEVWLGGDHYKWRLVRADGVPEEEITGNADDYTKFLRFSEVLPKAIGNPMYHWCHLELKRYFGFDGVLSADTAKEVYDLCNEKLNSDDMSARSIIERSNVKMIGTTDDPADNLEQHGALAKDKSFKTAVYPTFRPDKAVNIEKPGFAEYAERLGKSAGMKILSFEDMKEALVRRLDHFVKNGCRATDHGLEYMVYEKKATDAEANRVMKTALSGGEISPDDAAKYKTRILLFLAGEIAKRDLVMQLHFNVRRNTNTKMFGILGADAGFDCMDAKYCGDALTGFLNALYLEGKLPKTVIYSLNPNDNELIDSIIGCFQEKGIAGKLQHGAAWWFSDTKSGMENQMRSLANVSPLGNFIGMLTDSRSLLSYTRHEYFRRILCNMLGEWAENGEYPLDPEMLGKIVKDICYFNAEKYFGI